MADLYLDIRDRYIRAIVSDSGETRFQRTYALDAGTPPNRSHDDRQTEHTTLNEGELVGIIASIRKDAGISIDQAHLILPAADVQCDTHRLLRMPQQEAHKLLVRKTSEKSGEETPQISITPMAIDQNNQEWLIEYVSTETLRAYKKEFDAAKVKLKTVTTALDSTIHAISDIRESIFNADAIFEINATCIEAYYVSATSLLLHESLPINTDEDQKTGQDSERYKKRHVFTILDLLYRVNSHYLSAHPMTPLQKVWLCGTDTTISELSVVLQDAMDVETGLLSNDEDGAYVPLKGFLKANHGGLVTNFMHPDLLRRFPLRKKSGMLVYIATALLTVFFVVTTEYRHTRLMKQAAEEKKALTALKASQVASVSFAKNLSLLKKLSGSQVMFYPIFKELAMSLPDGVYLDTFNFVNKEGIDSIEISASFLQSSDLGSQKTLSRIMEVLNQSPYLKHYREPSVISTSKDLKKVMTVKFTCEVHPLDTAK